MKKPKLFPTTLLNMKFTLTYFKSIVYLLQKGLTIEQDSYGKYFLLFSSSYGLTRRPSQHACGLPYRFIRTRKFCTSTKRASSDPNTELTALYVNLYRSTFHVEQQILYIFTSMDIISCYQQWWVRKGFKTFKGERCFIFFHCKSAFSVMLINIFKIPFASICPMSTQLLLSFHFHFRCRFKHTEAL